MNEVFKLILSLSFSGSLVIIVLFFCRPLVKNVISKRWQYYIWLVAIARLVLPFSTQTNLVGILLQTTQDNQTEPVYSTDILSTLQLDSNFTVDSSNNNSNNITQQPESEVNAHDMVSVPETIQTAISNIRIVAVSYLWLVWLGIALSLLIRKITVYQSFINYIKAGWKEVSNIELLDKLAQTGEIVRVKRSVELYTNPLVSSPLLIGFFRPSIILPTDNLTEMDLQYTVQHELVHYKRQDMFYKWLVQAIICIHWFNPLVWLMGRELERACELSCDEAVIKKLDIQKRRAYGDTLLHAIKTGGSYKNSITSITLCQSAKLLKERLKAIMDFKQKSKTATALSMLFAVTLITGAISAGAYTGSARQNAQNTKDTQNIQDASLKQSSKKSDTLYALAKKCYKADNIAMFTIVFPLLDKSKQKNLLDKIYSNDDIAFFSAAISEITDNSFITKFAEKAYTDGNIAFFSVLTNYMTDNKLDAWLEKAFKDKKNNFAAMLYNAMDKESEKEEMNKELDKQRFKEYKAHGIIKKNDNYYYNGKLIRILLDIQPGGSTYVLNMNPKGSAKIKITRYKNGKIKRISQITTKEEKKFFGGVVPVVPTKSDNALNDNSKISIPINISSIKNDKYIWLGTYQLEKGDKLYYDVSAQKGENLAVGFAKAGQTNPSTVYYTVSNWRTNGKLEVKNTWVLKNTVKSDKYRLFVHTANGGTLAGIKGHVTIEKFNGK